MNSSVLKNVLNVKEPVYRQICETCNLRVFSDLFFFCLLDQDLKGQCRQENWQVLHWFLPYFKEKGKYVSAHQDGNSEARLKKCSRHLTYARACVNKDFVHSGSQDIYRASTRIATEKQSLNNIAGQYHYLPCHQSISRDTHPILEIK